MYFFNTDGDNLNLVQTNGVYRGSIFFKSTSINVTSVEQVFVLNSDFTPVNISTEIIQNEEQEVFKTFSYDGTDVIETNNFQSQINIYALFTQEGVYNAQIILYTNNFKFAEIELEIELIGLEDRFKVLLNNMYDPDLLPDDHVYHMFRNSNIKEANIDYKILNEKNKELIMFAPDIFHHIGADKSFVNMLDYLGYDDVKIKEIWKNTKTQKLKYIQNKYQAYKHGEKIKYDFQGSLEWKKTNHVGLFFNYNKVVEGEWDQITDMPITEDNFAFSIEEILIKFKMLTKYLNDIFLPINLKLYSITGEGFYFEKIKVITFSEHTYVNSINLNYSPNIILHSDKLVFIEDLRKYNINNTYILDYNLPLSYYQNNYLSLSDPNLAQQIFNNRPDIPIAARIHLEVGGLFKQLKDLDFNTKAIKSSLPYAKWNTIQYGDIYEVEWQLKNIDSGYTYKKRGKIKDYAEHVALIPYVGNYEIEMRTFDLNNIRTVNKLNHTVQVEMNEALLKMFIIREKTNQKISTYKNNIIKNIKGRINNLFLNTQTLRDFNTKLTNFNAVNFLHDEDYKHNKSDVLEFNRDEFYIKTNINKPLNGRLLAIQRKDYDIKGIKVDFSSKIDTSFTITNINPEIINALNENKNLIVEFYKQHNLKTEIDNFNLNTSPYTLTYNGVLPFSLFDGNSYLYEIQHDGGIFMFYGETSENTNIVTIQLTEDYYNSIVALSNPILYFLPQPYFNYNNNKYYIRCDQSKFNNDYIKTIELNYNSDIKRFKSVNYDFEIDSSIYLNLLNFSVEMFFNEPMVHTEILKYQDDRVYFKEGKWEIFIDDNFSFDIITQILPLVIEPKSYNFNEQKLIIKFPYRYHQISTNTDLYWTDFAVDIVDTYNNTEYILTNYHQNMRENSFILTAIGNDFNGTFLNINNIQLELTENTETNITLLNQTYKHIYFIQDPLNENTIIGKSNVYLFIETFNGLLINNDFVFELNQQPFTKFNINKLDVFQTTKHISKQTVFFSTDVCNIHGLSNIKITILKDADVIFETNRTHFTYKFQNSGVYSVNIELKDNNNNLKKSFKNNILYVE